MVKKAGWQDTSQGALKGSPEAEASCESGGFCGGASTAVTPIPPFVLEIAEAAWLIGISIFFETLLTDDWKKNHEENVEVVHQTIDYNNYLPTSYDDYRDWPTVAGTGFEGVA